MLKTSLKQQGGIVMLEALIGLLLFSIGVLGIIALQGASLQNTIHASYRADATLLATRAISESTVGTFNLVNWQADVAAALPAGDGNYNLAANVVTITIQWQLPSETTPHSYSASGRVCPDPTVTTC